MLHVARSSSVDTAELISTFTVSSEAVRDEVGPGYSMTSLPIMPRVRPSIVSSLDFFLSWGLQYPMSPRRSIGMSAKCIGHIFFVVSMSLTKSAAFDFCHALIVGSLSALLYVTLRPSGVRFNGERSASYVDFMNIALTSRKANV